MSGDVRIRVTGLARSWSDGSGLRPVSFELIAGELTVVRGRSGSGKSTLLALLAGWCDPDAGRIERVGDWATGQDWRRWDRTTVLPQTLALLAELTLADNIGMARRSQRENRHETDARVARLCTSLGVAALQQRRPSQVSLGQAQRAALARALVVDPVVVLVDEPTSHQDGEHAQLVIEALRAAALRGASVLVASHDERVVEAADRVVDLDSIGSSA